jgi:hypothetical protein
MFALNVSRDLDHARAKIEALPERADRAFDTLSGGVIRLFAQVNALEQAYRFERAERVRLREDFDRLTARLAKEECESRRITVDGKVDARGSTPASRLALAKARRPAE